MAFEELQQRVQRQETHRITAAEPNAIRVAAAAIARGELVVFPTDTLYGVGANAFDNEAILRLYAAKQRPLEKGIPVLLADFDDVEQVARAVPDVARQMIARYWPGPLTLIVPKRPDLPPALSNNDGVAVRMPDSDVARAMVRAAGGALATSSANRSGQPPAQTADEALAQLRGVVTIVLDGGPAAVGVASTIVDCRSATPHIIRPGPIAAADLLPDD